MLVYGDRARTADPRAEIAALKARMAGLDAPGLPIERHARLAAVFIAASELAQGLADAAATAAGADTPTPEEDAATALLMALARALLASWEALEPLPLEGGGAGEGVCADGVGKDTGGAARASRFETGARTPSQPSPFEGEGLLERLAALPLPASITLKSAEGYAFYALYPEAYAAAARKLSAGPGATVIGVRSIGLGLAAVVAAELGADPPFSVRPVGPPFQRRLVLAPALEAALRARSAGRFVVVDEGPGLSGSSFGAVADTLERLSVARARVSFLPGHGGDLGPQASAPHRARWATAERPCVDVEALILQAERPANRLPSWFLDLTNGAPGRLQDLSGGGWRALRYAGEADWPAVDAFQERRKFLLEGGDTPWLLKFQGLGAAGERAFAHARRLAEAGFTPPARALRHGFTATPWLAEAGPLRLTPATRRAFAAHLGRYFGWRAAHLPASDDAGASLPALLEMARVNAVEALGEAAGQSPALDPARWNEAPAVRRVWTDNRLHAREWLTLPDGRWLKTDAVDHSSAHDLVGAQDIAWDVAGARTEFDLDPDETEAMLEGVQPVDRRLVELLEPAYLAFQLGAFTMATDAHAGWPEEQARLRRTADSYRHRLALHLGLA